MKMKTLVCLTAMLASSMMAVSHAADLKVKITPDIQSVDVMHNGKKVTTRLIPLLLKLHVTVLHFVLTP